MYIVMSGAEAEGIAAFARKMAEIEERLREYIGPRTRRIEGSMLSPSSYIDGSYVCIERRGCVYTLLSAASLRVVGEERAAVMGLPGKRRPLHTVLFPKKYHEVRASNFMRIMETLAGLWELRSGARLVVMDGSYLTLLLTPYNIPLERIECSPINTDEPDLDEALEEIRGGDTESYYEAVNMMLRWHESLAGSFSNALDVLCASLQLSLILLIGATFRLLSEASAKGVPVVWVSKDTESYLLMRSAGIEELFNDVVTLDEIWLTEDKIYVNLDPSTPVTKIPAKIRDLPLVEGFYRKWGSYVAVYAKLSREGAPLQVTLPEKMAGSICDILATLSLLSDRKYGYPAPLIQVHHLTVLSRDLAEKIANNIWAKASGALRTLLAPKGRALYGLPG